MAGVASACHSSPAPILLFTGTGTSAGDVSTLKDLLDDANLGYDTANSKALDAMAVTQLRGHHLLLVPGGNFEQVGNGLATQTAAIIREAIHGGLNYMGICAGAFFAGNSPCNGLNLTSGVRFGFYRAEAQGIRKTAVRITTSNGRSLDQYWEDGPQLSGWGEVVARYPDATPAIVQGTFGAGRIVLTGTHPEAPASWRAGMHFDTPVEDTQAYALALIRSALSGGTLRQL